MKNSRFILPSPSFIISGPSDYTSLSRVVTFSPGIGEITLPVQTADDSTLESSEQFQAVLTLPSSSVSFSQPRATVLIQGTITMFSSNTNNFSCHVTYIKIEKINSNK